MPESTFIEVFEWNGPMATTTSWYDAEKRDPENQKVESYVVAFRYYDAIDGRGERTNVSPTYFLRGTVYELKDVPDSAIRGKEQILEEMARREIQKVVVFFDHVHEYHEGDVILNRPV